MPFKHQRNLERSYRWTYNGKFNWNVFLVHYEKSLWTGPVIYVIDILVERMGYLVGVNNSSNFEDKPICETLDTIVGHLRAGTWKSFVLAD